MPCNCEGIEFGTYEAAIGLKNPFYGEPGQIDYATVDTCIKDEVLSLWNMGIRTTGCCCGHNIRRGFIGVTDPYIDKMRELGYENDHSCIPSTREDTFFAKTGTSKKTKEADDATEEGKE